MEYKIGDWFNVVENKTSGCKLKVGEIYRVSGVRWGGFVLQTGLHGGEIYESNVRQATPEEIAKVTGIKINENTNMSHIKKYKVGEIKGILEGIYNDPVIRRTTVPLFMSNTGLGKTYVIQEFMEEKGVYKPPFVLSQRMPFEVSGMALVDKEKDIMKYYDFDFLLELKDGDILFIDETYNANPLTLSAFLTFLESRIMISGKKLPDIMIVAAANPQGKPVLTPQIHRRFLQYDIVFDDASWKNFLSKKFFMPKEVSSKLCNLIKNEDFTGYNYDTSADLDKAIEMIIKGIPTPYDDIIPMLNTLIQNPIKGRVKLNKNKYLEENENISWLELIKLKK
ncbi:MAG: AAA family ATPase [Candidatus Omnitrophica bacterium]|jgi:hypothetical protein|nr:AAA family ATPase [Candidatus Omnitrophota bacterium]